MLTYGAVNVERWKPEQTHASAYLRACRIILHGDCLTTIGGVACDPYLSMDASVLDAEVGKLSEGVYCSVTLDRTRSC